MPLRDIIITTILVVGAAYGLGCLTGDCPPNGVRAEYRR